METTKKVLNFVAWPLILAVLSLIVAGITGWLPHSDDKYYVALTGVATLVLAVGTLMFMWKQTEATKRVAGFQMFSQVDAQYYAEHLRVVRSELSAHLIYDQVLPQQAEEVLDFFEIVACYMRKGFLDADLVSNGFSLSIRCYWYGLNGYVREMRAAHADRSIYEHVEWLNSWLVAEFANERGIKESEAGITKDQANRFFRTEATTVVPPMRL